MTKTLTEKEIKELIKAQVKYKQAEDKFKELKEKYCKDLEPGSYVSDAGRVVKILKDCPTTDWNRMLADNPQINKGDYTTIKQVESITIRNDMIKGNLFD